MIHSFTHRRFSRRAILLCLFSAGAAWAQAPTNLTVTAASSKSVTLTWSGTAASYTVQRAPLGGTFSAIGTVSVTTAQDTQFDAYTAYQYQVVANLTSGPSAASNTVTAGPPPPNFSVATPAPASIAGSEPANYGFNISMVLDANGDPAFAFLFDDPNGDSDASDTQLLFLSWNRAHYQWNSVVKVATVGDSASNSRVTTALAYDAATNTYVLASEINQTAAMKLFFSSDGGVTWTEKANFTGTVSGIEGPSLAIGGGNVYFAYVDEHTGLTFLSGRLTDSPSNWQKKVAATLANQTSVSSGTSASLALDSAGNPAVTYWVDDTTQSYNTILLFWKPLSAGNPVKVLDTQNNQSDTQSVLRFYNLNPRVVVHAQRNDADFGIGIHFVKSDDGGLTWSTPVVIPPDIGGSADYPADLALDSQDHGAIVFEQNSSTGSNKCGFPKLAQSADLATWTTCAAADVSITGNFSPIPSSLALAYAGNDKLYLIWQDSQASVPGIQIWREPPANTPTSPSITTVSDNLIDGGAVVPGAWFYVKGANLADVQRAWTDSDFTNGDALPTNLSGVEVHVNGVPAPVYAISNGQIDAQTPSTASGTMTVQVFHNGLGSNTLTASVAQSDPGLFYYQRNNKNYPAALFLDYSIVGDPAVAGGTKKAHAGDVIQLYVAGLGPSPAGSLIRSGIPIAGVGVKIGSADAQVLASALVAPGQFQVNFMVPQLDPGEYPITVTVGGKNSQANVMFEVGQ